MEKIEREIERSNWAAFLLGIFLILSDGWCRALIEEEGDV